MASLLGSMVAGGVQGGAAAQQKTLFDQIDEQRKLSFAKIQQDYAQQNAELVNKLTMGREEKGREWQDGRSVIERAQELSDLEKAQIREDEMLKGSRQYELDQYNSRRANARADFSSQLAETTKAEKDKITAMMQLKEENWGKFLETPAASNLTGDTLANMYAVQVLGVPIAAAKEPTKLSEDALKIGAEVARADAEGKKVTPEELAVSVNKAARLIQDGIDGTNTKGQFEPKDAGKLVELTRKEMRGDKNAAAELERLYGGLKGSNTKTYIKKLRNQINDLAESNVPINPTAPAKSIKETKPLFQLNRGQNEVPVEPGLSVLNSYR